MEQKSNIQANRISESFVVFSQICLKVHQKKKQKMLEIKISPQQRPCGPSQHKEKDARLPEVSSWISCSLVLNNLCAFLELKFCFTFFFFSCLSIRWKPKREISAKLVLHQGWEDDSKFQQHILMKERYGCFQKWP